MHEANEPPSPPPPRPRPPPPLPPRSPSPRPPPPGYDENTSPMYAEEEFRAYPTSGRATIGDHRLPPSHSEHLAKSAIPPWYPPATGQTAPAHQAQHLNSGGVTNSVPPSYSQHIRPTRIAPNAPIAPAFDTGAGVGPPNYAKHTQAIHAPNSNPLPDVPYTIYPVVGTETPSTNIVPGKGGLRIGSFGLSGANAPPPDYARDSRDGSGYRRRSSGVREDTVVKKEMRRKRWALFLLGNVVSVGVLISDIAGLDVCFDETVDVDDDELTVVASAQEDESWARGWLMATLVFGLWLDIASAVVLSWIYRSPLDIKSVHKIPADDMRHCGGNVIIFFLAPFSWSLIYLCGGAANLYYGTNTLCEGGHGGEGLRLFLAIMGLLMLLVGGLMSLASLVGLFFTCARCSGGCCSRVREKVHKKILSKGPIFDLLWQLQGVIWAYVGGSFSLGVAIFLGMTGVAGQVMIWFGSFAPDVIQELLVPA